MIKSGLGFTEMQGSTAECVELGGSHNPVPDQIYFEVLDEPTQGGGTNGGGRRQADAPTFSRPCGPRIAQRDC